METAVVPSCPLLFQKSHTLVAAMVAKFDGDEPPQLLGSDHSHPAPHRWVKIVRPSFPPGQSHFRLVALHPSRARGSIVGFTAPTGSRDQAMESRGRSTAPAWRRQAFGTFTRGKPKIP